MNIRNRGKVGKFFMTKNSVAFGLPWFTSGLKKVVFDDRMIIIINVEEDSSAWVTRLECPKAAKDEGKRSEGPPARRLLVLVEAYFNIFPFG